MLLLCVVTTFLDTIKNYNFQKRKSKRKVLLKAFKDNLFTRVKKLNKETNILSFTNFKRYKSKRLSNVNVNTIIRRYRRKRPTFTSYKLLLKLRTTTNRTSLLLACVSRAPLQSQNFLISKKQLKRPILFNFTCKAFPNAIAKATRKNRWKTQLKTRQQTRPKTIACFKLKPLPKFLRFRRLKLVQHILHKRYYKILRKRILRKKKLLDKRRAAAKKSSLRVAKKSSLRVAKKSSLRVAKKSSLRVAKKSSLRVAKNKHRIRLKARLTRIVITKIRRRRYVRRLKGLRDYLCSKANMKLNTKLNFKLNTKLTTRFITKPNSKKSNSKKSNSKKSNSKKSLRARINVHSTKYRLNATAKLKNNYTKLKLLFNFNTLCIPFKLFCKSKLFKRSAYKQNRCFSFITQQAGNTLVIKPIQGILKSWLFNNLVKHNVLTSTYFSKKFTKLTSIYTTHGCSFINYKGGLVLNNKFSFRGKLHQSSFLIKKKFYSFLKINEYKKYIFDSRKKFLISKILKLLNTHHGKFNSINFFVNSNMRFLKKSKCVNNVPYVTSPEDYIHSTHNKLSELNSTVTYRELHMPRVRFKPGYQRLWRNFRLALADLVNFRYTYQRQLTRYLIKFSRKLTQSYYSFNENDVTRVVIYTRLIPDEATFNLFHTNNLIFLNNRLLHDPKSFIYKNDFLQLEITNWYYIFSRWLISATQKRNLRFKTLVFKKSLASRYSAMKQVKQKSNHTPSWITTVRHDFADIKPFLEVDFFTLSAFCIYDYNIFTYYSPDDIRTVRFSIYRLYNWKYVN